LCSYQQILTWIIILLYTHYIDFSSEFIKLYLSGVAVFKEKINLIFDQ
jgi:hypothetical protein